MRQKTIFRQLIINVVIPVLFAFLGLAIMNYYNTKKLLLNAYKTENIYISDEIKNIIEFQDLALAVLEERLNEKMQEYSNILVSEYFNSTQNIEEADLFKIREKLGMNPESCYTHSLTNVFPVLL